MPKPIADSEAAARRARELLAKTKTDDVVDALLAGLARDGDIIITSDADDISDHKHLPLRFDLAASQPLIDAPL